MSPRGAEEKRLDPSHVALVKRIAGAVYRKVPASVARADLEQDGLVGLCQALESYQQKPGTTFETYAARRIRGAMLDGLRDLDDLSRDIRPKLNKIKAAVNQLEQLLGRAPRAKEVAECLGWKLSDLHAVLVVAGAAPIRDGEEFDRIEEDPAIIAAAFEHPYADPMLALQWKQRKAVLSATFDALEEVERYVMERIYDDGMTLMAIAQTLQVSESRISQISTEVVAKMKLRLKDL